MSVMKGQTNLSQGSLFWHHEALIFYHYICRVGVRFVSLQEVALAHVPPSLVPSLGLWNSV